MLQGVPLAVVTSLAAVRRGTNRPLAVVALCLAGVEAALLAFAFTR